MVLEQVNAQSSLLPSPGDCQTIRYNNNSKLPLKSFVILLASCHLTPFPHLTCQGIYETLDSR